MGWSGPRGGYRTIEAAIADEFAPEHIEARHVCGPGVAWVLLAAAATKRNEPLIVCVLLDAGMVKTMSTIEGPYYTGCPLAWYERAPLFTEYGYDAEWRTRNWAAAKPSEQDRTSSAQERAEARAHETAIPEGSRYYGMTDE